MRVMSVSESGSELTGADNRGPAYKGTHPVEEGKSVTGSGAVADDPKGPKFVAGPSMSTGGNPPPQDSNTND